MKCEDCKYHYYHERLGGWDSLCCRDKDPVDRRREMPACVLFEEKSPLARGFELESSLNL